MEEKSEIEKSKLKKNKSLEDGFLEELKGINLTKASDVKESLIKSFKKDEDSKTGN